MSGATPMELATARRILALVPHARRFPVGHLRPPTGVIPSFVRSLGELEFVLLPQADSLPGVHFERLAAWIENDVGDPAGAAAVREATAAAPSYVAACQAAYERIRDHGPCRGPGEERVMSARGIAVASASAVLFVLGVASLLPAQESPSAPAGPSVSGELAFSETIVFDYDRDGKQERVQFWIAFEARPAPGEPSPKVESGTLRYYVYDLDAQRRVDDWMLGFNMTMGGDFPRAGEDYPLTNVRITGRQAQFEIAGTAWTIVDGGDSWEQDRIEVRDVSGPRKGRFYGGDVRVVPDPAAPAPLDIAANRECNECHGEAAVSMAARGGPHRELECASCHTQHPPDADGVVVPACLDCHEGHGEAMTATSCAECHAGHDVARTVHTAAMPDSYCAACHADVAETLRASRSLHMGVKCVLCHQQEHAAPPKGCDHCHRGTHPQHVMQSPDRCRDCHRTAHAIERGRAE